MGNKLFFWIQKAFKKTKYFFWSFNVNNTPRFWLQFLILDRAGIFWHFFSERSSSDYFKTFILMYPDIYLRCTAYAVKPALIFSSYFYLPYHSLLFQLKWGITSSFFLKMSLCQQQSKIFPWFNIGAQNLLFFCDKNFDPLFDIGISFVLTPFWASLSIYIESEYITIVISESEWIL